jgi:hypothetical protein
MLQVGKPHLRTELSKHLSELYDPPREREDGRANHANYRHLGQTQEDAKTTPRSGHQAEIHGCLETTLTTLTFKA